MKNFIEVIKANKGPIVRKGLIVAGTLIGLAIIDALRGKKDEEETTESVFAEDTEEKDEGGSQDEQ